MQGGAKLEPIIVIPGDVSEIRNIPCIHSAIRSLTAGTERASCQTPNQYQPPKALELSSLSITGISSYRSTKLKHEPTAVGAQDTRFQIDWLKLGPYLAERAFGLLTPRPANFTFDGMNIYASYNPQTQESRKFRSWATGWLDRQPGIQVDCRERKPKALPRCPACHRDITHCPHDGCQKRIIATVEKGVDTLIATDMIRLAWEQAYDVAVLATLDSDLVPAVQFLAAKGLKVIQAGFPPKGIDLATACWGSIDIGRSRDTIRRAASN